MPCYTRMKNFLKDYLYQRDDYYPKCVGQRKTYLQYRLLWLLLIGFGVMALSPEPGFLDFDNLPDTNFSCVGKVIGGYYADLETNCQMFHVCTIGQLDEPMDIRFLCLNGTVFDQETRVCERIDEVDCTKSEKFYSLNLELYGNTQPPILEDSHETEPPIPIKSSSTTTTTTSTTTPRPKPKASRPYYSTATSPPVTTPGNTKVISSHHFPVINTNSPDIRFNPEEINISLNPGAPPDIRTKPVSFQQQSFSDSNHSNNKRVIVTTHTTVHKSESVRPSHLDHSENLHASHIITRPKIYSSTQKTSATPSDVNFGFTFHQLNEGAEHNTHNPSHSYHYEPNLSNLRPPGLAYLQSHEETDRLPNFRNDFTTRKYSYHNKVPTTYRSHYQPLIKTTQHYTFHASERTENPNRLQLPLPSLPTLSPLTFSTPAPFTLSRHIDAKRFTNEHQEPPRIVISASASVSDASGRRLNYSLGTIGTAHLLEQPPSAYDEYKDEVLGLEDFFHDVPKLKGGREKRETSERIKHTDIIKNEKEAVDVLKFLFDWYKQHREDDGDDILAPVTPKEIIEINKELAPRIDKPTDISYEVESSHTNGNKETSAENLNFLPLEHEAVDFRQSALFKRKSRFNIVGDVIAVTEDTDKNILTHSSSEPPLYTKNKYSDYVDDNYESLTYKETDKKTISNQSKALEAHTDNNNNTNSFHKLYDLRDQKEEVSDFVKEGNQEESKVGSQITSKSSLDVNDYVDDNYEPVVYDSRLSGHSFRMAALATTENPPVRIYEDKELLNVYNKNKENQTVSDRIDEKPEEAQYYDNTNEANKNHTQTELEERFSEHRKPFYNTELDKNKENVGAEGDNEGSTIKTVPGIVESPNYSNTYYDNEYAFQKPKERSDAVMTQIKDNARSRTHDRFSHQENARLNKSDENARQFIKEDIGNTATKPNSQSNKKPNYNNTYYDSEYVVYKDNREAETKETEAKRKIKNSKSLPPMHSAHVVNTYASVLFEEDQINKSLNSASGPNLNKKQPDNENKEDNESINKYKQTVTQKEHTEIVDTSKTKLEIEDFSLHVNKPIAFENNNIRDAKIKTAKSKDESTGKEITIKNNRNNYNIPRLYNNDNKINKPVNIPHPRRESKTNELRYLDLSKQINEYIGEGYKNLSTLERELEKFGSEGIYEPNTVVNDTKTSRNNLSSVPKFSLNLSNLTEQNFAHYYSINNDSSFTPSLHKAQNLTHGHKESQIDSTKSTYLDIPEPKTTFNLSFNSPIYITVPPSFRSRNYSLDLGRTNKSSPAISNKTDFSFSLEKMFQNYFSGNSKPGAIEDSQKNSKYVDLLSRNLLNNSKDLFNDTSLEYTNRIAKNIQHADRTNLNRFGNNKETNRDLEKSQLGSYDKHRGNLQDKQQGIHYSVQKSVSSDDGNNRSRQRGRSRGSGRYFTDFGRNINIPSETSIAKISTSTLPAISIFPPTLTAPTLAQVTSYDSATETIFTTSSIPTITTNLPSTTDTLSTFFSTTNPPSTITENIPLTHTPDLDLPTTDSQYKHDSIDRMDYTFIQNQDLSVANHENLQTTTEETIDRTQADKDYSDEVNYTTFTGSNAIATSKYVTEATKETYDSKQVADRKFDQVERGKHFTTTNYYESEEVGDINNNNLSETTEVTGLTESTVTTESYYKSTLTENYDTRKYQKYLVHDFQPTEKIDDGDDLSKTTISDDEITTTPTTIDDITNIPPTTVNENHGEGKATKSKIHIDEEVEQSTSLKELPTFTDLNTYVSDTPRDFPASLSRPAESSNRPDKKLSADKELSSDMKKLIAEVETNTRSIAAMKLTTENIPLRFPLTPHSEGLLTLVSTESNEVPKTGEENKGLEKESLNRVRSRGRSRSRFNESREDKSSEKSRGQNQNRRRQGSRRRGSSELIHSQSGHLENSLTNKGIAKEDNNFLEKEKQYLSERENDEDVSATDAPLYKSVNPTQDGSKQTLETTPLTTNYKPEVKKQIIRRNFIFNCFGREVNRFYSDPRDCRLFHYCTQGYTKNQLLDMKFVCDLNTYFDDEKLICTKTKPLRCL